MTNSTKIVDLHKVKVEKAKQDAQDLAKKHSNNPLFTRAMESVVRALELLGGGGKK